MARSPERPVLFDYLEALLLAVVLATFARTFVVQVFKIPSASMEENLLVGDHLVVNKFVYGPTASAWERRLLPMREVERGDVVVFRYPLDPERDFIKRCIGLPGDRVEIVDKRLLVNEREVDDDAYTFHRDPDTYPDSRFLDDEYRNRDQLDETTVPAGAYFCLGDNRDHSTDSRFWGPVPESFVKGRALLVYWSLAPSPPLSARLAELGAESGWRRLWHAVSHPFTATRWERTFRLVR